MAIAQEHDFISVEDYLAGEPEAKERHEYVDGIVYAMSGTTKIHNLISGAILTHLFASLKDSPCQPYISDVKVRVKTLSSESYYYPDVVVSCDERENNPIFLEFPSTIFEVLSKSTERIDRQEKFLAYKSLDTLQEYILVSQERKEITVARRKNDWQPEVFSGDNFEITLSCGTTLSSADIYDRVEW